MHHIYRVLALVGVVATAATLPTAPAVLAQPIGPPGKILDFEYYRTRVEPILRAKRSGHARCIACHIDGTPLRLQPLQPDGTWSAADSRKNYELMVQRVVAAGNPKSKLLLHPLLESAGGDFYHNGGKHWRSQDDAEFQVLKAWIMGATGQ